MSLLLYTTTTTTSPMNIKTFQLNQENGAKNFIQLIHSEFRQV